MTKNITIFNQLLQLMPKSDFNGFVGQHNADRYTKNFSCWQQLTALLYAQVTGKDSLREIETGLRCQQSSWKSLEIDAISRSNLSYANNHRSYEIFRSLFHTLLSRCKELSIGERKFDIQNDLYSIDSTTIGVCLNLFPWAKFKKQKGAFKLHTLFNHTTQIPEVLVDTPAKYNDLPVARDTMDVSLPKGSVLVMDRAYIDYAWLYSFHKNDITFVLRMKRNMNYVVLGQHKGSLEEGVLKDQRIAFILDKAEENYPEDLRKVTYYDKLHDKTYEFFTNNFDLPAKTIADIYKDRWQIELFFKWIKQHLKIKTFLGTSKNAVLSQIWVAMIYYLILSYIKFQTKFKKSLLQLARMIQETLLQKISIIDILSLTEFTIHKAKARDDPQLAFF